MCVVRMAGNVAGMFLFRNCKQAIQQIIDRGQGLPQMGGMDSMGEGGTVVELNIPGSKVGLIIGKGGETIRQLQVSASGSPLGSYRCHHRSVVPHARCGLSSAALGL